MALYASMMRHGADISGIQHSRKLSRITASLALPTSFTRYSLRQVGISPLPRPEDIDKR